MTAKTPHRTEQGTSDEDLVATLRQWGLRYLSGGQDEPGDLSPTELVEGLAQSSDSRVRNSLAVLLAVHPELDSVVADSVQAAGEAPLGSELQRQHVAAACLQRMWWTLLREHRPGLPRLQDRYAAELELPSPDVRHGKICLAALSDRSPFNLFASYEGLMRNQLRHPPSGVHGRTTPG